MREFLNKLSLQVLSGMVVAFFMFLILLPFRNTLDQLTNLAISIEKSVAAITAAANIDPEQISSVSEAVKAGSEVASEGIGDGAASIVGKVKSAFNE